jgi:hypothetical protein
VLVGYYPVNHIKDIIDMFADIFGRESFRERYLQPALAENFLEMIIPVKPNSLL